MKTAKWSVGCVEFQCPVCDEGITAPNGSYLWYEDEYDALTRPVGFGGRIAVCTSCAAVVRLPMVRF